MIGIEFEYNQGYEKIIEKLFANFDIIKYKFNIVEQEIIYKNKKENIEIPNKINCIAFKECFITSDNYYITFLNLHIYGRNQNIVEINNYQDFMCSNCQLVLLIHDAYYFEIYFKEEKLKEIVLTNLSELNIKYDIKTKENDSRTSFYVN